MTLKRSVAISCAVLLVAGVAITYAANAQTPAKPRVVQVANTTPAGDRSRTPATKALEPQAAVAAPKSSVPEVLINREAYAYPGTGRRDPFVSLMNTEELRPLIGDLKLVAIAFDATGRNSVAVLRDMSTKEQYRVKVGQELGRMRVAAINVKNVVFGIEEFGYSRQESLAMTDSTKVRTQ